jgi:hypothetical protein
LWHHFDHLRLDTITNADRSASLAALRDEAELVLASAGVEDPILAWALGEAHDEPDFDYAGLP